MKKLLLILLCLPLLFTTCKKEDAELTVAPLITINNAWQLSMQCTYLAQAADIFVFDTIQIGNIIVIGMIQLENFDSIMVINDTIFPDASTSYSSRVWSINENQFIIDTYYDENGFSYNISEHNFTKNLDTLVISFQSDEIKKFVINKLTADQFHITSIPDTNYIPVCDINGIYQDTLLMNLTSDKYVFNKIK